MREAAWSLEFHMSLVPSSPRILHQMASENLRWLLSVFSWSLPRCTWDIMTGDNQRVTALMRSMMIMIVIVMQGKQAQTASNQSWQKQTPLTNTNSQPRCTEIQQNKQTDQATKDLADRADLIWLSITLCCLHSSHHWLCLSEMEHFVHYSQRTLKMLGPTLHLLGCLDPSSLWQEDTSCHVIFSGHL